MLMGAPEMSAASRPVESPLRMAFIFSFARSISRVPNFRSAQHSQKKVEVIGDLSSNPVEVGAAQLSQNEPLSPIAKFSIATSLIEYNLSA